MPALKNFLFRFLLVSFFTGFLVLPLQTLAAENLWESQEGLGGANKEIGKVFGETGEPKDVRVVVANYIKIFLSFLGLIFVLLILSAGFQWMTSYGNDTKITDAKKKIYAGVIGLVIIIASYAVTQFVLKAVWDISQGEDQTE